MRPRINSEIIQHRFRRFTLRISYTKNIVQVIGKIWMPYGRLCAMEYTLSDADLKQYGIDKENPTRESIERWTQTNTGDFSSIQDFYANIGENKEIKWKDPESEFTYSDCMFPADDLGDMDIKAE